MAYYDLSKPARAALYERMREQIALDLDCGESYAELRRNAADPDTYIRKNVYLILGRLYGSDTRWRQPIIAAARRLLLDPDAKVRQTMVNAFGEIGIGDAPPAIAAFEHAMHDEHHSVRNAVIGSLKKMGARNPQPVFAFARRHLHHPEAEVRREIIHGIELRGRTHPKEALPLLKQVQHERIARVRNMIVHVIGQISYKRGCLEKVVPELLTWDNVALVEKAIAEILDVHVRYAAFSAKTYEEAKRYVEEQRRRG